MNVIQCVHKIDDGISNVILIVIEIVIVIVTWNSHRSNNYISENLDSMESHLVFIYTIIEGHVLMISWWWVICWFIQGILLLMEEILHHLGCIKPCKWRDKLPINWCRISAINSSVSFAGWFSRNPIRGYVQNNHQDGRNFEPTSHLQSQQKAGEYTRK